jgi:aspartate dehydrogenase family protein
MLLGLDVPQTHGRDPATDRVQDVAAGSSSPRPRSPAWTALSLAGIGPEKTRIRLYAVPGLTMNLHRITVVGEFGRLAIEVESGARVLRRDLAAPLRVGT